jgi:hypothetical protein
VRTVHRIVLALIASVVLTGCVTPTTGPDSYRAKAHESVSAAISEVASARRVVDLLLHDRLLRPYADEVLSANEDALGSINDTFLAVQPPSDDPGVDATVPELLGQAEDVVRDSRIAARRSDTAGLQRLDVALGELSSQLSHAEEALR